MSPSSKLIDRFHRVLVEEIRQGAPAYLGSSFTVAEIYQSLIPYRTHRDRLGVEINGDYEDALLRLLSGEGEYLLLESEPARVRIRKELEHQNPNTGIYREFAAVGVRLNPKRLPDGSAEAGGSGNGVQSLFEAAPSGGAAEATADREQPRPRAAPGGPGSATAAPSPSARGASPQSKDLPAECPECKERLPDREGLRFCPRCGANVLVVPCGECGEPLDRGWRFCVACGSAAGG
jgi:hypothetical protein